MGSSGSTAVTVAVAADALSQPTPSSFPGNPVATQRAGGSVDRVSREQDQLPLCRLGQSQESVDLLALGASSTEAAGRETASQWEDGSWPPAWTRSSLSLLVPVRPWPCFLQA